MFFAARRHIPDDRLTALIHMHMLDPHELRATLAQPTQLPPVTHTLASARRSQPDYELFLSNTHGRRKLDLMA